MIARLLVGRGGLNLRIMSCLSFVFDIAVRCDCNLVMLQALKRHNGRSGNCGAVKGKGKVYGSIYPVLVFVPYCGYFFFVFRCECSICIYGDVRTLCHGLTVHGKVRAGLLIFQNSVYSISHSRYKVLQFYRIHNRCFCTDGSYGILCVTVFCACTDFRIMHALVFIFDIAVGIHFDILMKKIFKCNNRLSLQNTGVEGEGQIYRSVHAMIAVLCVQHSLRVGSGACYFCFAACVKGYGAFRGNLLAVFKNRFTGLLVYKGSLNRIFFSDNYVVQLDGIYQFC